MNKIQQDILKYVYINGKSNQRHIASNLNCSLGMINKSLNVLKKNSFISIENNYTNKTKELIDNNKPRNAIILAAGIGLRMTPINNNSSKGLLYVNGKTLIENTIMRLNEVGINNIYIVVGYMKEQYEYLIDKYNVHLIVNNKYLETNNVYSLYLARNYIDCSYVIPCDLYFDYNPFSSIEIGSWYLIDSENKIDTLYKITKSGNVTISKKKQLNYKPLGIAYFNSFHSNLLKNGLNNIEKEVFYKKHYYWENFAFNVMNIEFHSNFSKGLCVEINNYEDLRDIDENSISLKSDIIDIIQESLNVTIKDINNITLSKKGMTNRSFLFEIKNQKYIMRIPGEGTDHLINRKEEGEVYSVINDLNISDDVIYFNSDNGYKLTKFIEKSRVCNLNSIDDLNKSMELLKKFHSYKLKVNHYFDLYEKIEFYESLWGNHQSLYNDYLTTKENIYKLKSIVESLPQEVGLTHIDAVPDNFLIYEEEGIEKVKLIDWEYASMQDTHLDIAMFCIYSMYEKKQVDQLIDIYFKNKCSKKIRIKIYCYIAISGLLWSNWCEYKYTLGVEFGEYSLAQYRYAKEYYKLVMEELKEIENV